jgi:uncharacterized protein (DUF1684 family)
MSELDEFRREKDHFYKTERQSPLSPAQKRAFTGLKYFPENPDLALELEAEIFDDPQEVNMQTSTGDIQSYTRYGQVTFSVEGQPARLTLYRSEDGFFLPFVDALAPHETYGAGRYLEPQLLAGNIFWIDFNYAYNPYCAYNENWSCPITPAENRLKVPIRAGEMNFH